MTNEEFKTLVEKLAEQSQLPQNEISITLDFLATYYAYKHKGNFDHLTVQQNEISSIN